MFFVRNFNSLATVLNGSLDMGAFASGAGALKMCCAAETAAAQEDWLRRREGL